MTAEHFTQGRMDQVRRRVIAARRVARDNVNFGSDLVACFERSFFDSDLMED